MGKGRVAWVDISKGIGIILVVYGHVLRGLHGSKIVMTDLFFKASDKFIYSFHMPLFFLLSGLFFYQSFVKRNLSKFLENKWQTLVFPYIIWVLLQTVVEVGMSSYTNSKKGFSELAYCLISPPAQFWFLYALFFINLFNIAIFYFLKEKGLYLSIILALLLFALKLPIPAFEKALQNLIYFNLGIWMSFNNSKVNAYLNNWFSFFGIVLLFIGSEFLFFNTSRVILELPMFFSAISGVAIIIFLANKIPDKSWASKLFSYLGSNSMPIYLASIIWGSGARIFLMKITKVYNLPIHLAVGTITGIACSLLMFEYCKKSRYLSWFFEYPLKRN